MSLIEIGSSVSQLQLVGLGLLTALFWVVRTARRDAVSRVEAVAFFSLGAVAAVVGGRTWALLSWWLRDPVGFRVVLDPLEPAGYASAGALLGAAAAALLARSTFGLSFWRVADAVTPAAFLALAFARLGCVVERCDPGRPTDAWGVIYPDGAQLHAFGAYIALPMMLVVLLSHVFVVDRPAGVRAGIMIAAYGMIRFTAEFWRDTPTLLHNGHLVAVAALAVGLAIIVRARRRCVGTGADL